MTNTGVRSGEGAANLDRWRRDYATRLLVTDLAVVLVSVFGAQLVRFGVEDEDLVLPLLSRLDLTVGYTMLSLLLVVGWMVSLEAFATRSPKVVGAGTAEYKRIADATIRLFAVLAIVAFLLQSEVGRGYLLIALPLGLVLLLLGRWAWRQWLNRQRAHGGYVQRAVLVGERGKLEHIATQLAREPNTGIQLVGAVTERGDRGDLEAGVPVLGGFDQVLDVLDATDADTVIFNADRISPRRIRQFGWDLEARSINLIVAPALTDIAGPRIHARPVAGLPLIHVDFPEFEGRKYVAKRLFDIVGASLLILFLGPVMIAVAIAVGATSAGGVFYAHERIGLRGEPFKMLKFRSMAQGADDQLKSLLDAQGTSDKPLFKIENDPRITPVGRIIRRYSLDELPQFFNVVRGDMSLVGPRPQVAEEVELYDHAAHRRLFMKPGITGIWQVSGRSSLDWDDAIRLDLYYVENWSVTGDLVIMWRTLRAVLAPGQDAH